MASASPFRSTIAIVVISLSSLFACTGGTAADFSSPELIVPRYDEPYASHRPAPSFADFERELALFEKAVRAPARFPLSLVAEPADPATPLAAMGAGRATVTPGRAACERQAVPPRSRRKLRTWERDAAV